MPPGIKEPMSLFCRHHAAATLTRHSSPAAPRSRAGFAQEDRPSSFMFLGPTGCGKTELAKALAETMFGGG